MTPLPLRYLGFSLVLACCVHYSGVGPVAYAAQGIPDRVQIVAPDGLSTKIYSSADPKSEALGIALNGDVLETIRAEGPFYEVRVPDRKVPGFVLKEETVPWKPPEKKGHSWMAVLVVILGVLLAGTGGYFLFRARQTKQAADHAAAIPNAIRRAEELFRAGEYGEAATEFNNYLRLQGGEVRNPDVYRRLTACYQRIDHMAEAAQTWEKMRELGGVKTQEDYAMGVDLMIAQGREAEAADIYEDLVLEEQSSDKEREIRRKLLDLYKKLKDPRKFLKHAVKLMAAGDREGSLSTEAVNYLIAEGQTDLAVEANAKELIQAICREFLEDKVMSHQSERIYLKCLEYDRTDLRLHRMLAKIYSREGDFRKAVSELTILTQLDKDHADSHMEEAARLYVEVGHVNDALAEGNPIIVKKIAQIFLARSEVHTDAVATYEKVLEIQPKAVGINKMLSTVYMTRGELDKYMERLRLLHEIDGSNHDYLTELALCVIDNDLIEQTIKEGNRDLNAKIVKQLIKRGTTNEKALSLLEKLLKAEPENLAIRGSLIRAYERKGEPVKCFDHLAHVVKSHPKDKESVEKAATMAVEHNLLEQVLQQGSTVLLAATAAELARQESRLPLAREIIERATGRKQGQADAVDRSKTGPADKNQTLKRPSSIVTPRPRPQPPERRPEQTTPARVELTPPAAELTPQGTSPATPSQPTAAPEKRQRSVALDVSETKPSQEMPKQKTEVPGPPIPSRKETPPKPALQPPEAPTTRKSDAAPPEQPKISKQGAEDSPAHLDTRQIIEYIDPDAGAQSAGLTTFVSGFDTARGIQDYRPEELFRPATGGLAYKDTDPLVIDDWGKVLFGVEVNTNRQVIIRVFKKDLLESSSMKSFVDDVSDMAYNMRHENILPLEEVVTGLGGVVGFIHPYLFRTLEQIMRLSKQPQFEIILSLMKKVVAAMAFAHYHQGFDGRTRRTYHFHLAPDRILLSEDLRDCRVMGFGFSQIYRNFTRASKPRWQEPGMNPATMPPEFFRSRVGTISEKAADIYSLGAVLYFMATGDYPFEGPSFEDYKFGHTKMNPAPARLANPAVPDWLDIIMLKCLEKDPEKRWETMAEIQQAFEQGQ